MQMQQRWKSVQYLHIMEMIALSLLKIVQTIYNNKNLKGIRYVLDLNFETEIKKTFTVLNVQKFKENLRAIEKTQ